MSLFRNLNNQQTPSSGGLFGAAAAAPATSSTGLFGASTTTQPTTSGGLFGGLNTTNQAAQPSAGLFGNTTQKPQGSSLFGGLGSTASTQQPATTTASTTALGGLGLSTQPQQGTSFGGSTLGGSTLGASTIGGSQQAPQNEANSAYFNSILENTRKRGHAESAIDDLPQLQLGLGDLRQRIKRVGTGAPDRTADGRAHYLLLGSGVDPGAAVRDLNQFTSAAGRTERQQAVESQEIDVESYLANLQTQTTLSMIADGLARSVRDFDNFLEENVSMEWDAQRKRIYEHFGIKPKETSSTGRRGSFAASGHESGGFGRSRRSKAAGLASSRAGNGTSESVFGRSMQKSVIGAAGPVGQGHQPLFADVEKKMEASGVAVTSTHDRFQRDKQSKLAEKVQALNYARLQKRPYPICKELALVVQQANDQHGVDLIKAYRALMEIVEENPDAESFGENRTAKERAFAERYLDESPNSSKSTATKKAILRGGARILEKLAYENVQDIVQKNPRDAALGGIPSVINYVKAYVRLQAAKKNLFGDNADLQQLGDDYVWALVYHLLRTGHVSEARQYVEQNVHAFRAIDRNFAGYIRAYDDSPDRILSADLQGRINSEYIQRLRVAPEGSIDPYRMACLKIIGRCDLGKRALDSGLKQDVEDFTWLQLVLARELNRVDSMASEVYDLVKAQETVRQVGYRHFAKGGAEIGSSFGAFVFMQVAMGMFEEAVSYLYTYSYVDGIHLAIALDFYGLLRVSDPNSGVEDLLSLTTKGQSQISFGSMVGLYTRDFRAANVTAAVDYLTLICLNSDLPGQMGRNQITLCHEALRELVLESREFTVLLGDMQDDGQRIKGAIEQRMKLINLDETDDFMRTITMQAASVADDNGRVTDAVLLYHLAGEYDNVMVTINRSVSEAVAVPLGQEKMRIQPVKARPEENLQVAKVQDTHSSLASIEDPIELGQKMNRLYMMHVMYRNKLKQANIDACGVLLKMAAAKQMVEEGRWTDALTVSYARMIVGIFN
jgi:nuclear pore complex protein Nup93